MSVFAGVRRVEFLSTWSVFITSDKNLGAKVGGWQEKTIRYLNHRDRNSEIHCCVAPKTSKRGGHLSKKTQRQKYTVFTVHHYEIPQLCFDSSFKLPFPPRVRGPEI